MFTILTYCTLLFTALTFTVVIFVGLSKIELI